MVTSIYRMFYTVRDKFTFIDIYSEKPLVKPVFLSDSILTAVSADHSDFE